MAAHSKPMLKFGILCWGTTVKAWQSEVLRSLIISGVATPALLIIGNEQENGRGIDSMPPRSPNRFVQIYNRYWVGRRSRALRPVSLERDILGLPRLRPEVRKKERCFEFLHSDDIDEVHNHRLDFVLAFGFPNVQGGILDAAEYGIWSFRLDNDDVDGRWPPGSWEISENEAVTCATLQRLTKGLDSNVVLFQGFFKTQATPARNLDNVYFGVTSWCIRVCNEIRLGQVAKFSVKPTIKTAVTHHALSTPSFLQLLIKQGISHIKKIWKTAFYLEMWNIALVKAPIQRLVDEGLPKGQTWLRPPGIYRFFADPFAVTCNGKLDILVEEFDYLVGKGSISSLMLQEDGHNWTASTVIKIPQHMSYPYVFKVNGQLYCVPETWEAGKVMLYKAAQISGDWELSGYILDDVAALDPTIFQHQELWWLFCTIRDTGSESALYAWYGEDFEGPWRPHPLNPLKCDVRSARPGGRPFEMDGILYRPSQDCSRSYGGAVTINRIIKLTPTEFEEEPFTQIYPDPSGPYPDGIHTVCPCGEVTIIDGKCDKFTLFAALVKIRDRTVRWRRSILSVVR